MKITALETLRLGEFPNLIWLRIHTDEGVTGTGETYFGAQAVQAFIHESVSPRLLGQDPRRIEGIHKELQPYVGFSGTGTETRGRSVVDVALWDLVGNWLGQPIYQLLGGLTRPQIRTYNTCAGYRYVREKPDWKADDWGLDGEHEGPYEDLDAFLNRADELAKSLLSQGITGMKIWPFDFTESAGAGGYYISNQDLDKALEPFAKIRDAVGNKMDIHVELHSIWRLPAALKIAKALEPYDPFWYEDPVRMDSLTGLKKFADSTRVPVVASETVGSSWDHRALLDSGAPDILMPDIVWCGGLTEAKKIAALADTHHLPLAPHDCTGPLAFATAVQFTLNIPNALVQESVRAFHSGWYRELADDLPEIENGYIQPPPGSGLGTRLKDEVWERPDATVVKSEL